MNSLSSSIYEEQEKEEHSNFMDSLRADIMDKSEVMLNKSLLEMTILTFLKTKVEENYFNQKI